MRVHELQTTLLPPKRMNNPFGYEPHPLCLLATEEVRREVIRHADWMAEVEQGKMLGVLAIQASSVLAATGISLFPPSSTTCSPMGISSAKRPVSAISIAG